MVRVVPLFVVVMLATIAMIVLVSSIVMGVKFLFSNKRQTFGILMAGFVLAILAFVVVTGAYILNHRYERAEYQARLHYELDRSQAALSRQFHSEMHDRGVTIEHVVADAPVPPVPHVHSLTPSRLAVDVEKEQVAEAALHQVPTSPQADSESEAVVDSSADADIQPDEESVQGVDAGSGETLDTADAISEEPANVQTDSSNSVESSVAESSAVDNIDELDASIAKVSNEGATEKFREAKSRIPEWFQKGESLTEWRGETAKVVASAKSDPRLRRLELELMTKSACVDRAMQIQEEMGIDVSTIRVTDKMMEACQRESFTVSQPLPGGGLEETVYQLLIFDDEFSVYVQDAVKNNDITQRLQTTTILSGIVLTSVTFLYGTFSFLAYWRRPKSA